MAINSFKVKNSLNVAPQAAPPSSPALGDVYVDLLGNYFRWSGVAWTSLGSAGSGGINYLINSNKAWNFDDGASTGWGVYADAAGVAPVDGTGGSPNVTFAASATAPLRGAYSGLFTKDAANRQGQGVSVDFTLDTQDVGKPFTFSFDTSASAAFTGLSGTESMRVYCYDVTNAALLPGYVDVAPGSSTTKGFFLATTSTSYRFILHVSGTGTSAWTLKIDNVTIGQQPMSLASTTTDWQDYTPTFNGLGTVTSIVARWRRVGDSIQVCGTFTTGTVSGSGIAYMSLPNSYQINTTIVSSNRGFQLGTFSKLSSTAQNIWDAQQSGSLTYDSTAGAGNLLFAVQVDSGSYRSTTPNNIFNNTENHSFISEMIPISGLSSNIVSGDRAVEEFASNSSSTDANDTTSFANGPAGSTGILGVTTLTTARTKRVRFQTPIQPTDTMYLEIQTSAGGNWVPIGGETGAQIYTVQNPSSYGIGFNGSTPTSTDTDIVFGQYRVSNAASFGGAGPSWNQLTGYKWRVRKISGGALVGYPIGARNVIGDTTGTAVPSNLIGEVIPFTILNSTVPTGGTGGNLASAALPRGNYLIVSRSNLEGAGTTWTSDAYFGTSISTTSATINTLTENFITVGSAVGSRTNSWSLPLTVASAATYYIVARTGTSAGTPTISATYGQNHYAIRIA